ncbi:MAG: acetyl-CoA carboxylase biotin carboxyl carrier protein [Actinomycetota bacterium]|nr:acetyl-CoA carboxylase biotin carboxyl carrier protein [Actinomycetota bacterium]
MKKIKINDITIRDIFQNTELEYLDTGILDTILEEMNGIKYDSLEVLGGSSFEKILDSSLGMVPLDIISYIKNRIPSTPLQVLIGARNLGGLEVYPKDIIERFVKQCKEKGIDIFRVYDSLNDTDNLKYTISAVIENKADCQGTIIYDELQNNSFYIKTAKKLKSNGCSSICIKDVESVILPKKAAELFKNLSSEIDIPILFSATDLRGLQILNYFEACRNGCDGVDLSLLPSSYNDCSPTVFSFILSLNDTDISHNLDYSKIIQLSETIKRNIYPIIKQDTFSTKFILNNTNKNLLPKWLISNIGNQLAEIGETESMDSVLEEISTIKNELGSPSLATPLGQIIGSQAILNAVISDSRWEIMCDEIKKLINGYFGKIPRKIDKKILEKLKSIPEEEKSAVINEVEDIYPGCKSELEKLSGREEDILSYCFFPEKTRKFLEEKKAGIKKPYMEKNTGAAETGITFKRRKSDPMAKLHNLDVRKIREITSLVESSNIEEIKLEVEGVKISINNPKFRSTGHDNTREKMPEQLPEKKSEDIIEVRSPIVGTFYAAPTPDSPPFVKVGDRIKKGDTLCIIEAMKLMNKINADHEGQLTDILVSNENAVEFDQVLMVIKEDKK